MTTTGSVRRLTATQVTVLDDPVWHALTTSHAHIAQGTGAARCYPSEVTVFAAVERDHPDGWRTLHQLVGDDHVVVLARAGGAEPPEGWTLLGGGGGFQMIIDELVDRPTIAAAIEPLSAHHVPQMSALVELTQPGPFRPGTIELGNYVGVFADDQLVAMAGERLQTPEFVEISAVCTHPDVRGRGLAAALSHHVATGIQSRGQTPILHVAEHNVNAKRVYERLGFVARGQIEFLAFRSPGASPDPP